MENKQLKWNDFRKEPGEVFSRYVDFNKLYAVYCQEEKYMVVEVAKINGISMTNVPKGWKIKAAVLTTEGKGLDLYPDFLFDDPEEAKSVADSLNDLAKMENE